MASSARARQLILVTLFTAPLLLLPACGFPSLNREDGGSGGEDRDASATDEADARSGDRGSEGPPVSADAGDDSTVGLDGSTGMDLAPDGPADPDLVTPDPDGIGTPDVIGGDPILGCPAAVVVGDNTDDDLRNVTVDTFITEDAANEVHRNTDPVQINVDGNSGGRRHGLLRFELSSLAGCLVTDATLEVTIPGDESDDPYAFHEVNQAWDEAATWNEARPNVPWNPAGCTGTPCLAAAFQAASFKVVGVNSNPLDITIVQRWIDDPASNLGMLIRVQTGDDGMVFRSTRGADSSRPRLKLMLAPGARG